MTTYTLPVSEALAARMQSASPEERHRAEQAAVAVLAKLFSVDNGHIFPEVPHPLGEEDVKYLPPDDVEAIQEAWAQADANLGVDGDVFFAELSARYGTFQEK